MIKSLHLFFLPIADEALLSDALRARVPDISFIDDCAWPSREPPQRPSIDTCNSRFVYLWSPRVAPKLPSAPHRDGSRFQGPQSGVVVQLIRSVLDGDLLRAGTLSVGWEDSAMTPFVKAVWLAVRDVAPNPPACVNPTDGSVLLARAPMFRVGHRASAWCRESPSRFFRDATVFNYYRPFGEMSGRRHR